MDGKTLLAFLVLVFVTVFLLSQLIIVPTFGTSRQERKRMQARLDRVVSDERIAKTSLVRERYLKELSPLERWLEKLPGTATLSRLIEQSGQMYPAYRVILTTLLLGAAGGAVTWVFSHRLLVTAGVAFFCASIPFARLARRRRIRLERFEEQLPEALELMVRALRAGHPFDVAMSFIGREMDDPVAHEFGITFDEIRYGRDIKRALIYLLERVPSMTLMAMTTAIFIQRETGGNLAEVLEKIGAVLRGRFKFARRVRTLTAEGRVSAWVLALIPLLLFGALSLMNPGYMEGLTGSQAGQRMLITAVILLVIGIVWINKMIKIDV